MRSNWGGTGTTRVTLPIKGTDPFSVAIAILPLKAPLNRSSPYHGLHMKKILIMALTVLGLSAVIVLGSAFAIMQPIIASSGQETADEDEPQDQQGEGDGYGAIIDVDPEDRS